MAGFNVVCKECGLSIVSLDLDNPREGEAGVISAHLLEHGIDLHPVLVSNYLKTATVVTIEEID